MERSVVSWARFSSPGAVAAGALGNGQFGHAPSCSRLPFPSAERETRGLASPLPLAAGNPREAQRIAEGAEGDGGAVPIRERVP